MAILALAHVVRQAIPATPPPVAHGRRPIQHRPTTSVCSNPPQGHNLRLVSATPQHMIVDFDWGSTGLALM